MCCHGSTTARQVQLQQSNSLTFIHDFSIYGVDFKTKNKNEMLSMLSSIKIKMHCW